MYPHPPQQQPKAVAPDFFVPRLFFTIPHLLEKLVTALSIGHVTS